MEPVYDSPTKFELQQTVREWGKTGDILFRTSDGRGPFNIPFMRWVAKYTQSHYTHAAILVMQADVPYVYEVSDTGTTFIRFIDWIDYARDCDFGLYRLKNALSDWQQTQIVTTITAYLAQDLPYDFSFNDPNRSYCTESVCEVYRSIGINLQNPETIEQILTTYVGEKYSYPDFVKKLIVKWMVLGLKKINQWLKKSMPKYGLPMECPLYFVGNTKRGILSSEQLERVL